VKRYLAHNNIIDSNTGQSYNALLVGLFVVADEGTVSHAKGAGNLTMAAALDFPNGNFFDLNSRRDRSATSNREAIAVWHSRHPRGICPPTSTWAGRHRPLQARLYISEPKARLSESHRRLSRRVSIKTNVVLPFTGSSHPFTPPMTNGLKKTCPRYN